MPASTQAYLTFTRHYLMICEELQGAYEQGGDASIQALDLLDKDLALIIQAQLWASEYADSNKEAAAFCGRFADTVRLLHTRLPMEQRLSWVRQGISAAQRISDRRAEASHLGNLGMLYHAIGRINDALECHTRAAEIAEELQILDLEFAQWFGISNCHLSRQRYDLALYGYRRALNISRWLKESKQQSLCYGNIAHVLTAMGDITEAIDACESALELSRESEDLDQESLHLMSLAGLLSTQGDYSNAKQCLAEALSLSLRMRNSARQMAVHSEYSKICLAEKLYEEACLHLASALRITQHADDRINRGHIYAQMGDVCLQAGWPFFALECYKTSYATAQEFGNRSEQAARLIAIGATHNLLGQYHDAVRVLRSVDSCPAGCLHDALKIRLYLNLAATYLELDLNVTANKYIQKAMRMITRAELMEERVDCLLLMGKHALRCKGYALAAECHRHGAYLARSLYMYFKECQHLGSLGEACNEIGRYEEAKVAFGRAKGLASDLGAPSEASRWAGELGDCCCRTQDYEKAIHAYRWGLQKAGEAQEALFELRHLARLAGTYVTMGKASRTRRSITRALRVAKYIGQTTSDVEVMLNLANAVGRAGGHRQAARCFRYARDMSVALQDRSLELRALVGLAVAQTRSGWRQKAIGTMKLGLRVSQLVGDWDTELMLLDEQGKAHAKFNASEALVYHRQALDLTRRTDHDIARASIVGNMGVDYYNLKDHPNAIACFEEALVLARRIGEASLEGISLFNIGDALHKLGEKEQSLLYARRGISIIDRVDGGLASQFRAEILSWV